MSNSDSAGSYFSRAFFRSGSFRRRAWLTSMPPYYPRQR